MSSSKYYRQVEELAKEHGAVVEWRKGHGKIRHEDGWFVVCAGTPKNHDHALCRIRRDLEKRSKLKKTG